jgi:hypothetical protein
MGAGVRVSGAFALGVWALGLLGARGGACGCGEVGLGVAWVAGGVGALAGGGLRPPFFLNLQIKSTKRFKSTKNHPTICSARKLVYPDKGTT